MSLGELTDATVRHLYATTWLPGSDGDYGVAVPGGSVRAVDAAGNLLHIAMWSLRDQELMEFEQLRPAEEEKVRVLGARPSPRSSCAMRRPAGPASTAPSLRRPARPQAATFAPSSARSTSTIARHGTRSAGTASGRPTGAVMSDCLRTVADAYSPDLGD